VGELEDKLNSILSSPEDMQKIMGLARSLSGSLGGDSGGTPPESLPAQGDAPPLGDLDPKMLGMLTRLMGQFSASSKSDKTAILNALTPYLKDDRKKAIGRAAEIAKIAKVAKLAFSEFSGGDFNL
jgi:hypothetical protein